MIAICLNDTDKIIDVETKEIFAEHFFVPGHRYIYMALSYLYQKDVKPTPLAIMEVLSGDNAKDEVDKLGGLEYLLILENTKVPSESLQIFIEKVKQSHTRRMLLDISFDTINFITSNKADVLNPNELIMYIDEKINNLTVNTNSNEVYYKMGDDTENVLLQRAETPSQVPGIEVGWKEFDTLTNGGLPGDLIVLVAPSKTGKSTALTNWATKIAIKDRVPILYFDTEMNERSQEDRILANLTGIPYNEIVSGMYVMDTKNGKADDKVAKLKVAREELQLGEYYHIYIPSFTIEKVNSIAKKFAIKFGIKAIFFDYIKIPASNADFKSMQEYQALGFFTSGLKDLAGNLNMPVFTSAQTNRNELITNSPDASNIGGSYRILQLATKLVFLYNKSEENIAKEGFQNGNQQIFIKYQRNGMSDCPPINIMFKKEILRQSEV